MKFDVQTNSLSSSKASLKQFILFRPPNIFFRFFPDLSGIFTIPAIEVCILTFPTLNSINTLLTACKYACKISATQASNWCLTWTAFLLVFLSILLLPKE